MEQPIRQRLVGAGVILALGVILLSWIYEPVPERSTAKQMPPAPEMPVVPEFVEKERQLVTEIDLQATTDRQFIIPAPEVEVQEKTNSKPQLKATGVPQSWVLQMGVFAKQENAKALVKRLQTLGYKAYSRHWDQADGKAMDTVYIGPMVDQYDLLKKRDQLAKQVDIKGVLVRYRP